MTVVYLIRHGESELNRGGMFRGTLDVPLNEHGRLQAEGVARALAKVKLDAVFSSPLARALDTAHTVALAHKLDVRVDRAFTNINLGEWQGRPKTEIAAKYPREWDTWVRCPERLVVPGGESVPEVRARAWDRLCALVGGECRDQRIAIVTHRTVIKVLLAAAVGLERDYFWKFYVDPASYSVIRHSDETGFYVYQVNVTTGVPASPHEVF